VPQADDQRRVIAGLAFTEGRLALVAVYVYRGAAGRDRGGGQGQVDAQTPAAVERARPVVPEGERPGTLVRLPEDTEWGQHEGVLTDPDGNVIRFGLPMD
jgi:hypothetical protein